MTAQVMPLPETQVEYLTIFQLIPRLLAALQPVGKEGWNEQQKYAFRSVDGIYNAVHDAEAEVGVFHMPKVLHRTVETLPTKGGGTQRLVTVEVEYRFYGPQGDSVVLGPVWGEATDSGDKATSKAQTAALKYGLIHALCIALEGDHDADAQHVEFAAPVEVTTYAGADEAKAKELGWASLHQLAEAHDAFKHLVNDTDNAGRERATAYKKEHDLHWPMTPEELASLTHEVRKPEQVTAAEDGQKADEDQFHTYGNDDEGIGMPEPYAAGEGRPF